MCMSIFTNNNFFVQGEQEGFTSPSPMGGANPSSFSIDVRDAVGKLEISNFNHRFPSLRLHVCHCKLIIS